MMQKIKAKLDWVKRCCTPQIEEWMPPELVAAEIAASKAFRDGLVALGISCLSVVLSVTGLIAAAIR